jgi:hypothetical protein
MPQVSCPDSFQVKPPTQLSDDGFNQTRETTKQTDKTWLLRITLLIRIGSFTGDKI